jgi:hypothetical protein
MIANANPTSVSSGCSHKSVGLLPDCAVNHAQLPAIGCLALTIFPDVRHDCGRQQGKFDEEDLPEAGARQRRPSVHDHGVKADLDHQVDVNVTVKKPYQKPAFTKREQLSAVTAVSISSGAPTG